MGASGPASSATNQKIGTLVSQEVSRERDLRDTMNRPNWAVPEAEVINDGTVAGEIDLNDHVVFHRGGKTEKVTVRDFLSSVEYGAFGESIGVRFNELTSMPVANQSGSLPISKPLKEFENKLLVAWTLKTSNLHEYRMVSYREDGAQVLKRGSDKETFKGTFADLKERVDAFSEKNDWGWTFGDVIEYNQLLGNDLTKLDKAKQAITLYLPRIPKGRGERIIGPPLPPSP